jgi:2-keto-4-pentenoate hydratase
MYAEYVKEITVERKGITKIALVRQMPHDEQAVVGRKIKLDTGAKWTVIQA